MNDESMPGSHILCPCSVIGHARGRSDIEGSKAFGAKFISPINLSMIYLCECYSSSEVE